MPLRNRPNRGERIAPGGGPFPFPPPPSGGAIMFSHRRTLILATLALILAGCQVRIDSGGGPNATTSSGGDPAEQDAIKAIKKHEGYVTQDDTQPNKPVVQVWVHRPSFTDAHLKDLASFSKLRKVNIS